MMNIPIQALLGQLTIGLINGAFYAMLSLGLAVIFGMLRVVNFAHGAQFTLGAFAAWMLLTYANVPYWGALFGAPLIVAIIGMVAEKLLLRRLYDLDELYQILLTFGMALLIEGLLTVTFGSSGLPYDNPLPGGMDLGFMFLPYYRVLVIGISILMCLCTWCLLEKTRVGMYLRATAEHPELVRTFGINVPKLITGTYGFGVGLAALAGVLASPMDQIKPLMGAHMIITVFAIVVIGGMGSIMGTVLIGFSLGLLEALTKLFLPQASNIAIFLLMVVVIVFKPTGLFGRSH